MVCLACNSYFNAWFFTILCSISTAAAVSGSVLVTESVAAPYSPLNQYLDIVAALAWTRAQASYSSVGQIIGRHHSVVDFQCTALVMIRGKALAGNVLDDQL